MQHKKNLIILTIIFIIFSVFLFAKTGNALIDFSRETYIPYKMLQGDVLIKDIFLIYGAFGYIVNLILYKFATNINLLIFEAHLISYAILILFYLILSVFFTKKVSFIFSVIFLIISIFSQSTFSFVLPYSYSTLWAILGLYATLFCLLYNKKIGIFLFLGLILANKIEYFIPAFLISIGYLIYKKENFLKEFFYILIFPSFPVLYFLFSNISSNDIAKNFSYIKTMLDTKALKSLYDGMGVFFEINYFKYSLQEIIKLISFGAISYFFYFIKKENLAYIALIIGLVFTNFQFSLNLIAFVAFILTIINLKKETISKDEVLLFLFSIILCSKAIFAINSLNYSNFGYCLIVFYVFLEFQKLINKKWLINCLLIFFVFGFIDKLTYSYSNPKLALKTDVGNIWFDVKDIKLIKSINTYIQKNIKENEKFIVVPEGQIFNLIHKKPYNFYNTTFTPLDFETFGEVNIIRQLHSDKTDYIIFYPRNTKEYGAQTICYNYGKDFCKYIIDNYTRSATIEDNQTVLIFKKKK